MDHRRVRELDGVRWVEATFITDYGEPIDFEGYAIRAADSTYTAHVDLRMQDPHGLRWDFHQDGFKDEPAALAAAREQGDLIEFILEEYGWVKLDEFAHAGLKWL